MYGLCIVLGWKTQFMQILHWTPDTDKTVLVWVIAKNVNIFVSSLTQCCCGWLVWKSHANEFNLLIVGTHRWFHNCLVWPISPENSRKGKITWWLSTCEDMCVYRYISQKNTAISITFSWWHGLTSHVIRYILFFNLKEWSSNNLESSRSFG